MLTFTKMLFTTRLNVNGFLEIPCGNSAALLPLTAHAAHVRLNPREQGQVLPRYDGTTSNWFTQNKHTARIRVLKLVLLFPEAEILFNLTSHHILPHNVNRTILAGHSTVFQQHHQQYFQLIQENM